MYSFILAVASLAVTATALDGIVVPDTIAADTSFDATFENGNSDLYRVYLAAALAGATGPTCYLMNSTDLTSPVNLSIPASVGPSASYYAIAVADITTSQGATYSNRFNFTGGTGNYTDYENHLGGAAFWNADDLPCSSYECARQCAQASYPDDLTDTTAYDTMKSCILKCPGVSRDADANGPVSNTVSGTSQTLTAAEAIITLSNGDALTAVETTVTTGKSRITEAIVGSVTLTLGGAAATVSTEVLSFAGSGLVEGSTSTVALTTAAMTTFVTGSAASAASSSTSSAAAPGGSDMAFAGLAGIAGLAAFLL